MAITRIKATYSMEPGTLHLLEDLARRWGIPKSQALQRAIRLAARHAVPADLDPLQALDKLQESVGLNEAAAASWVRRNRQERIESSARRRPAGRGS